MVKVENEYAKILYKRSYTSYSKTTIFSDQTKTTKASNHVKIKPSRHKFYSEGGKIKRDLSIETDRCIIRRHFKQKLMQMSNVDSKSLYAIKMRKSARSKYSNYTEEEPSNNFNGDGSGCGDNYKGESYGSYPFSVNKENLMYDNLNVLFNNWVQHAFQENDLKSIIHNAIENAVQNSDTKKEEKSSSCTTYILQNNKKSNTFSSGQYTRSNKSTSDDYPAYILPSAYTVPIVYKTIRLISTLSIPKHMHKRKRKSKKYNSKPATFKMKKKHKKIATLLQSNIGTAKESDINIDLLKVSTKSWLRRCTDVNENEVHNKRNHENPIIVLRADSPPLKNRARKDAGEFPEIKVLENDNNRLQITKSLLHSIYGKSVNNTTTTSKKNNCGTDSSHTSKDSHGRGDNVPKKHVNTEYSCHKTSIKTSTILQETDQSDPMVTIDFLSHNLYYPAVIIKERQSTKACYKASKKDIAILCKRTRSSPRYVNKRSEENQRNEFTHLYRKLRKRRSNGNIMNNLQTALNYFMDKTNKNVELDFHVSVSPKRTFSIPQTKKRLKKYVTTTTDKVSDLTRTDLKKKVSNMDNTAPSPAKLGHTNDVNTKKVTPPTIIPLLDGAASKTEYVFKIDSLAAKAQEAVTFTEESKDQESMTSVLGLRDEIKEIKAALMNITRLVNSYFSWEHKTNNLELLNTIPSVVNIRKQESTIEKKPCPKIHVSKNRIKCPGIKLSKEGRHSFSTQINTNAMIKRSFNTNVLHNLESYRLIESESLIKVTNMATFPLKKPSNKDVALTCSLPQARSLYEKSSEDIKKQLQHKTDLPEQYTHNTLDTVKSNTSTHKENCKHVTESKSREIRNIAYDNYYPRSVNKTDCNYLQSIKYKNSTGFQCNLNILSNSICQKHNDVKGDCKQNYFIYKKGYKSDTPTITYHCEKNNNNKYSGTKTSMCYPKRSVGTNSKELLNNTIACQKSLNNANFSCQINSVNQSRTNKIYQSCQTTVETRSIATSDALTISTERPKTTKSSHHSYNSTKSSFRGQSSSLAFKTDTDLKPFYEDAENQEAKPSSYNLEKSKPSNPTEVTTNSASVLDGCSQAFRTKDNKPQDKAVYSKLEEDSVSNLKSTSTIRRRIKICMLFCLPVLIFLFLFFGYLTITKSNTLKHVPKINKSITSMVGIAKAQEKIPYYMTLNRSELGF